MQRKFGADDERNVKFFRGGGAHGLRYAPALC